MTDIRSIKTESGIEGPVDVTYWTIYKYDEAGNRVRKIKYKYTGSEPDPVYEDGGDNPQWQLISNEFYTRDVSGKEIAIYTSSALQQWNFYGLDMVGHMNADTTKYYYLKDHLGSTRVVLNSTNTVVSAQDFDCWGYPLENRVYESGPASQRYKFTGKERDKDLENNYDYFGARYYDARIANWTSIDPLLEKHFDYGPYNYVLRNPVMLVDPRGTQEAAVWRLTFEVAKTAAPWIGIPLAPIDAIITAIISTQEFGHAELKDIKRFYPGPEGYLEYPNELPEITVIALMSEGKIYIPEEGKIPAEEIFAPEERGLAPISKITGKRIEIHHIEQKEGGPYEERHSSEHRTEGSYKKYHDPKKKSEINRKQFAKERKEYWKKEWDRGRFENLEKYK